MTHDLQPTTDDLFRYDRPPVWTLTLPWPPSENEYRRVRPVRGRGRIPVKTDRVREFHAAVARKVFLHRIKPPTGRLIVLAECYPPDRRTRDLGNLDKALMDALEKAGAIAGDGDIDDQRFVRRERVRGGKVVVSVWEVGSG